MTTINNLTMTSIRELYQNFCHEATSLYNYSCLKHDDSALFPSEVSPFPQGIEWGDVQSTGVALPAPMQLLPGLLRREAQSV